MDFIFGLPSGLKFGALMFLGACLLVMIEVRRAPVRNDWDYKSQRMLSSPDE